MPKSSNNLSENGYHTLVGELKEIINKGLYSAYKVVDNIKVQTYWQIGERIVREELKFQNRAEYGKYLVEKLAGDLGFSRPELYKIVKYYRCYESVLTLSRQLSWSHYVELIEITNTREREFYSNKTIRYSWSVRELRRQIKSNLYQQASKEEITDTFKTKLSPISSLEIFKDSYDFDFMDKDMSEKNLEFSITNHLQSFLKILGEDFAFLDSQIPIKIDRETHFIDLVLQHRGIPCVILVELKSTKLDSQDIGQMNKYIGYWRRHRQYVHELDAIGLIICRHAGKEEIIYALDGLEEKIFISTYRPRLPCEEVILKAFGDF